MAHTYMVFEFPNEEKAQEARHKLERWKQAYRLDKKLQVKFDRGDEATTEAGETEATEHESDSSAEESKKGAKSKSSAAKSTKAAKSKKSDESEEDEATNSGPVKLFVRLYFSTHEKITEQQWLARIPADELFKVANPHVINQKDAAFDDTVQEFDTLEKRPGFGRSGGAGVS
jgi:hypothetical protein